MDPFLRRMLSFETVEGAAVDVPAPAEPAPAEPAVDPAPAAPAIDFNDPAVREYLDSVLDERLAGLQWQQQGEPAPAAPQGAPVDFNELLNPLNDDFGSNLLRVLAERDAYLLQQYQQGLEPIMSDREAARTAEGHQIMDQLIETELWDENRDGKLTDQARNLIKDLSPAYLGPMQARYGETPAAARMALSQAAAAVRALNAEAHGAGGQSNIDALSAVAGAANEPGTAGGAQQIPAPIAGYRGPNGVMSKYFGQR